MAGDANQFASQVTLVSKLPCIRVRSIRYLRNDVRPLGLVDVYVAARNKAQARRLLNDLDHYRAWQGELEGRSIQEREAATRWLEGVYRPAIAAIPQGQAERLDPAEIFHQLLEHRWYMSERAGRDVPLAEVVPAYLRDVLAVQPPTGAGV